MDNISRITSEMNRQLLARNAPDASRRALTTLLSRDGLPYYEDEEGSFWRLYFFIEGALGYDGIENEFQAYQAAKAFGEFQGLLTNLLLDPTPTRQSA